MILCRLSADLRRSTMRSNVSMRISSLYVCNILPLGAYGAVYFLAISVVTILDSGDSSCEHSKGKRPLFGVTFQRGAVRTFQGGVR